MFLSPAQLFSAKRIVSLVPSLTELLHHLDGEVTGITKFCIHPKEWFQTKTRVGGTKQLNLDIIRSLNPQLIIANKEENVKEQVKLLAEQFPVWLTDVNSLHEALKMIRNMGIVTGSKEKAATLATEIENEFAVLNFPGSLAAAYFIWKDPLMVAGGDTFINEMMKRAGFRNVFEKTVRYPAVSINEIKNSGADILLLSSEPYPFKQDHVTALSHELPGKKIILVDGEMFSWYGSRLLKSAAYFKSLRQHIGSHVF